MHAEGSLRTMFFCDTMPSAKNTCKHCMKLDQTDAEEPHSNAAKNVWYDHLAIEAADAGLINTTKSFRRDVRKAMAKYQEKTLKRAPVDFPLLCPTQEQLEVLLNASLLWEKELMSEMHSEEEHITSFWKRVDAKKYCFIDAQATLQMEEWKTFFRALSRL